MTSSEDSAHAQALNLIGYDAVSSLGGNVGGTLAYLAFSWVEASKGHRLPLHRLLLLLVGLHSLVMGLVR